MSAASRVALLLILPDISALMLLPLDRSCLEQIKAATSGSVSRMLSILLSAREDADPASDGGKAEQAQACSISVSFNTPQTSPGRLTFILLGIFTASCLRGAPACGRFLG